MSVVELRTPKRTVSPVEKILMIWPAAEFSTYDVAKGLLSGFREIGQEYQEYRLFNRIKVAQMGFAAMTPEGKVPDTSMVCLYAAEAIPYQAIIHETPWILFVNGMGLHPDALIAARRIGIKVVGWFTESPYDSNELELADLCDIAFTNERTSVDLFREHCPNTTYLRHGYDPDRHNAKFGLIEPELASDVVMVGTGFPDRQALIESIDWTGINFKLYGLWIGIKPPSYLMKHLVDMCTDNEDTVRLYRNAKIVLNPHRWSGTAESANPRVYECAALGVFQISDYREEIRDIFGDSIAMYTPGVAWELESMIRYFLDHPDEREQMAAEACRRVQGQTFRERASSIVDALSSFERGVQPARMSAGSIARLAASV